MITMQRDAPLDSMRSFLFCIWRRRVWQSFAAFMVETYGQEWLSEESAGEDRDIGRDCLRRCGGADWWEWRARLTLLLWRWPRYSRKLAQDGHPPWIIEKLPRYKVPQRKERDPDLREFFFFQKLQKVRDQGYITPGFVMSLTGTLQYPRVQMTFIWFMMPQSRI